VTHGDGGVRVWDRIYKLERGGNNRQRQIETKCKQADASKRASEASVSCQSSVVNRPRHRPSTYTAVSPVDTRVRTYVLHSVLADGACIQPAVRSCPARSGIPPASKPLSPPAAASLSPKRVGVVGQLVSRAYTWSAPCCGRFSVCRGVSRQRRLDALASLLGFPYWLLLTSFSLSPHSVTTKIHDCILFRIVVSHYSLVALVTPECVKRVYRRGGLGSEMAC
jgi:hypothetical protein